MDRFIEEPGRRRGRMKAVLLRHPGGLDQLELTDVEEPRAPGPGEITVRIRASSINYHDYLVVAGKGAASDKLISVSHGGGYVGAVSSGATEDKTSGRVTSAFFPAGVGGQLANRIGA